MRIHRSTHSSVPQPFRILVQLLLWTCDRLGAVVGDTAREYRRALEVSTAILLTILVTAAAGLGLHPVLAVGGGLSMAVLFVIAHSFILVCEQQHT